MAKEQPKLLDSALVQKLVGVIEGILAGQKKLIIESLARHGTKEGEVGISGRGLLKDGLIHYTHTFRIEDINNEGT